MSMEIETRLGEQIGRYLDLATSQIKLTAANMANIDTPGYRAVGMDFEAEMREALDDVDRDGMDRDGVDRKGAGLGAAGPVRGARPVRVRQVDGLIARPDGNDVSMDRERLTLAEAQLKFKTGVALLKVQNQMLMDAIHADK
jgi:flagellar basal-body rod protein FlgB